MNVQNEDLIRYLEQFPPEAEVQTVLVGFEQQNGDQDVKKTIMLTIGGCIAFIALSEALPLFFK